MEEGAMIKVLLYPSPALRRTADKIPDSVFGTNGLRRYADVLKNTMMAAGNGANVLCASHVNFPYVWRVLTLRTPEGYSTLCNPEIVDLGSELYGTETSYPFACVPAHLAAPVKLTVRYRTAEGERREVECSPSGARSIFQGVDGLDGHLMTDRMGDIDLITAFVALYQRKLREEREEMAAKETVLRT
jgi:peptide deformylase